MQLESGELFDMAKFARGDQVTWNSEVGQISGRIIAIHYSRP
ncbi:hypothetical protein FHT70_003583 [Rhizobium sp. BK049]|nr:hypothetical protein [Rhizobium sp. BK049]